MKQIGFVVVFLIVCVFAVASCAQAQVPCVQRQEMVDFLRKKYKEGLTYQGLLGGTTAALYEVFASESGTFTILMSRPDGLSCIVAAGKGWRQVGEPPKQEEAL